MATALVCGITVVYLWLITAGRMTECSETVALYSALGDGFLQGHTYLPHEPPPELCALPDPYNPEHFERLVTDISYDISFFGGKYYMYYGPVPALATIPFKWAGFGVVYDWQLVFAFLSGGLVFSTLLIGVIRRRLFPAAPVWTGTLGILVAGFGVQITSVLIGLDPDLFHECCQAGGYFFMTGALFWMFTGLGANKPIRWRLALAGTFLALAEGTRSSMAVAIMALSFMVLWRIWRLTKKGMAGRTAVLALISFGTLLLLGAVGLGAYNHLRFGSWHEFGQSYQFSYARLPYDGADKTLFFPDCFLPNLYALFLHPPHVQAAFPYLTASLNAQREFRDFIQAPGPYCSYYNTGILLVIPFLWAAGLPLLALIGRKWKAWRTPSRINAVERESGPRLGWIGGCLLAVAVCGVIPDLIMTLGSAMRYSADFVPSLVIFSMLGVWQGYYLLAARGPAKNVWLVYWSIMAILSAGSGFVLAFSYRNHFRALNPDLLDTLAATLPNGAVVLIGSIVLIHCAALCVPLLGWGGLTGPRLQPAGRPLQPGRGSR